MGRRPAGMSRREVYDWLKEQAIEVPAPDYVPSGFGPCMEIRSLAIVKGGYPRVKFDGVTHMAHRFVFGVIYNVRQMPETVRHRCDNPACINIMHLQRGTMIDNNRDRDRRGRTRGPQGEEHGNSRLSAEDVLRVREIYARGERTQTELARELGVDRATLSYAISGKSWGHL